MAYWITTILVLIALGVYTWYRRHPTVAAVLSGKIALPEREVAALDALLADAGVAPDRVRVVYADPETPCWSHAYRIWWEAKLRVYRRFGRFGENCIGIDRGQVNGLSLVDTQLADMTPLAELPALRHLQLRHARIETLAGLPEACKWTEVNLAQNALTDLAPLTRATALERVDVSFNRLPELPDLKPLARLERLDARQNELTDIAGLAGHPALTWIDLSGNHLTSAEGLEGLPRLESVLLGGNALTSWQALKNLPALRWLYAYGNQLQQLDLPPDSPALRMIDVSGNPIREMPAGFTYTGDANRGPTLTAVSGHFVRIAINSTPLAETLMKSSALFLLLGGLLALLGGPGLAAAQGPPSTDVMLVSMRDGQIVLPGDQVINLTDRDGYDNQPFFTPDGQAVLYTSSRDGQTDIYRVDLATRTPERVTNTPESEYSPTMLPTADGISTVRVEADGTQRLWRFDLDGENPALVLETVMPVGYHAWADAHTVVLFVLGQPPTLQQADTRTGRADTLVYGVGRSLHRTPDGRAISFVHKEAEDIWTLKTFEPATGTVTPVVATLPGREDYAWTPDGSVLMADGAVVYTWAAPRDAWTPLYDFARHGITTITRLAVSPDGSHLAFVVDRPD